jgi:hypothetical protein
MKKPSTIEIAVIVVALIVLALIPSRSDTTWIDPVTGSVKHQRSWWIYSRAPVVEISELERWVIRRQGVHARTWTFVSRSRQTIFNQGLSIGCAEAPMYLLRAGDRNDRFIKQSTDKQIDQLVQVMRTGTESEKRAAIRSAYALVSDHP